MKIHFMAAAMFLSFTLLQNNVNAQTNPAPEKPVKENKGHFVFGTNLVNYGAGASSYKSYSAGKISDSSKASFESFAFSLNIWAGYFVSDRVCVGLSFNNNNGSGYFYNGTFYGYTSELVLVPSNLFFRWYLTPRDSGIVDCYLEGLVGASYVSSKASSGNDVSSAPTVNQFNLNGNVNVAFSFNVSKHIAIPLKFGFMAAFSESNSPAFNMQPSQKEEAFTPEFVASLGLQYRL